MKVSLIALAWLFVVALCQSSPPLGHVSWVTPIISQFFPVHTISDGILYSAGSGRNLVFPSPTGSIIAVNSTSGTTIWSTTLWGEYFNWIYTKNGTTLVATSLYLCAIAQNGSVLWNFSFPEGQDQVANYPIQSPILLDSGLVAVIGSTTELTLYQFDIATGNVATLWESEIDGSASSASSSSVSSSPLTGPPVATEIDNCSFVILALQDGTSNYTVLFINASSGLSRKISFLDFHSRFLSGPLIWNNSAYFAISNRSKLHIVGFSITTGEKVFSNSTEIDGGIQHIQPFKSAIGLPGFAGFSEYAFTLDLGLQLWTSPPLVDGAQLMAADEDSFYLLSSTFIMRYLFRGSNFSWTAPIPYWVSNSTGPELPGYVFCGSLFYQIPLLNDLGDQGGGQLLQVNTKSGECVAHVPLASDIALWSATFDSQSFGGSVIFVGSTPSGRMKLFNPLPDGGCHAAAATIKPVHTIAGKSEMIVIAAVTATTFIGACGIIAALLRRRLKRCLLSRRSVTDASCASLTTPNSEDYQSTQPSVNIPLREGGADRWRKRR